MKPEILQARPDPVVSTKPAWALGEFEAQLIRSALEMTRGRRIEAAHKLGIGRNTITRKIQELGLDEK